MALKRAPDIGNTRFEWALVSTTPAILEAASFGKCAYAQILYFSRSVVRTGQHTTMHPKNN
ncbi:uncharacterized protein DS421_9g269730 [Arachis hypogaea]|nr:uncharacterized protein DS421_9g269730 [Arachis hypogaea]